MSFIMQHAHMISPHKLFDRDDPSHRTEEGTRDWKQIEFVEREMSDTWAGFIAYTYDGGGNDFAMFQGGPWDDQNVLSPTQDFWNFRQQLDKLPPPTHDADQKDKDDDILPRRCSAVEADFISCCDLRLFNDDKMHSYILKTAIIPVEVEVSGLIHQIDDSSTEISTASLWCAGLIIVLFSAYFVLQRRFVIRELSNVEEQTKLYPSCGKTSYGSNE